MKDLTMSAHNALQGSEIETRELLGGIELKTVETRQGVIDVSSKQINDFNLSGPP